MPSWKLWFFFCQPKIHIFSHCQPKIHNCLVAQTRSVRGWSPVRDISSKSTDLMVFFILKWKLEVRHPKWYVYNHVHFFKTIYTVFRYLHHQNEFCVTYTFFEDNMIVVSPGQQPITRDQISLHRECGHTIYHSVEDDMICRMYHCNCSQYGIHHYTQLKFYQKTKDLKKYHVSKFLVHYWAALQVTASLEEFSDLSDAEESNQFDIVRHDLQLATQVTGRHADKAAFTAASYPLAQSTLSKIFCTNEEAPFSPCLCSLCQCSRFHC